MVADFQGRATVTASSAELPSPVVISEIDVGFTDRVELQNVSADPVELGGWTVVIYDGESWPAPAVSFAIPEPSRSDPGTVVTVREFGQAPGRHPDYFLGRPLAWAEWMNPDLGRITDQTAVLLLDREGRPRDFLAVNGANPRKIEEPVRVAG